MPHYCDCQGIFARTVRLTAERAEAFTPAVRIGASDEGDALGIVTARNELLHTPPHRAAWKGIALADSDTMAGSAAAGGDAGSRARSTEDVPLPHGAGAVRSLNWCQVAKKKMPEKYLPWFEACRLPPAFRCPIIGGAGARVEPDKPHVVRLAPAGWKKQQQQVDQDLQPYDADEADSVSDKQSRSTWARLIAQVYEVDPLVCPRCSAPMRILAVITEPEEVRKILRHLVKINGDGVIRNLFS